MKRKTAVSFLDVSLCYIPFWGRMAFSSNPFCNSNTSCSAGTRKGREAPGKGGEQVAAPGGQAPCRLASVAFVLWRLSLDFGDRGFQLDVCSALQWRCENILTRPDSFFKSVALYHNEPGLKPMQNQEYNFPFLSQQPWQSSSLTLPFKPHATIICYPKSQWSAKDISAGQETWSRNPSEKITHYYFVHLRNLASPDHYGFEFLIL